MKLSYSYQKASFRAPKETNSFDELYKQYVGKVYQQCLSFTKDSSQAEDFTHDIFIKIHSRIADFKQQSSLATWLYAITRNHCLDQMKVRKHAALSPLPDDLDCPEPAPSFDDDIMVKMQALMDTLPAEELQLLRLKYEHQVSVKELAAQLGITESAVKMRLKRLREKVLQLYEHATAE